MTTNAAIAHLKYAELQMAAEALFGLQGQTPGTTFSGTIAPSDLITGNNRASRFTDVEAQQFSKDWVIDQHKSNTATGFSGTLFRCLTTDPTRGLIAGELVLSFRSTEFVDDAVRDNQATNSLEIKKFGWAFGQIADMRNWVDGLYASGKISASALPTVTGYSLGGHLATAFNLLYPGAAAATYTFNGAGVGMLRNGATLAGTIATFDWMRQSTADLGNSLFTDADVRALYESMRQPLTGGALVPQAQLLAAQSLLQLRIDYLAQHPGTPTAGLDEAQMLVEALNRIITIQTEAARIGNPPYNSGGTPNVPLVPVLAAKVEATDLNYQLAVLYAARYTQAVGTLDNIAQAFEGRQQGPYTISNFYDIYGDTSPSGVLNSQLHYGVATPVFIEDQPLYRGDIVWNSAKQSLLYQDIKLLDNNFAIHDFGDTHSLVLLIDSLSIQNALATLDPNVSQSALNDILRSASNATTFQYPGTQGKAEGDVLETIKTSLGAAAIAAKLGAAWGGAYSQWSADKDLSAAQRDAGYLADSVARDEQDGDAGNIIDAGAGNALLIGQGNDDVMYGASGNDTLYGDDRDNDNTPAEVNGKDYLGDEGDNAYLQGEWFSRSPANDERFEAAA